MTLIEGGGLPPGRYAVSVACSPSHLGIVSNVLDNNKVVIEFELQSRYYVHLLAKSLGKAMNPLTSFVY